MKFTYTFPLDYPTVELRGVTATDGVFGKSNRDGKLVDAILFSGTLNGKHLTVPMFVDGHPDLMALLAQENAHKAAHNANERTETLATAAEAVIELVFECVTA